MMIQFIERRGPLWLFWHNAWETEPRRPSPLPLNLPHATEAEAIAIAEAKLAEPLPPEEFSEMLTLTQEEYDALTA